MEDVTNYTKAGGGCGSCIPDIEKILDDVWGEQPPDVSAKPKRKLTNIQKIAMIQETIEREIRPLLEADGGDIELIDVEGDKVLVSFRGTCTGCLMANVTVENIEKKLKELVDEDLVVEVE